MGGAKVSESLQLILLYLPTAARGNYLHNDDDDDDDDDEDDNLVISSHSRPWKLPS